MKTKFVFFILLVMSFVTNAQIYTKISYLDKFDDVLKEEKKKTRISQTDTTFVIEVKGQKPLILYIFGELDSVGTKYKPVDLTGTGVYGYEKRYLVFRYDFKDKITEYCYLRDMAKFFKELYIELGNKTDDTLFCKQYDSLQSDYGKKYNNYLDSISNYMFVVVERTITTKYMAEYLSCMFWMEDINEKGLLGTNNVYRIIYKKD